MKAARRAGMPSRTTEKQPASWRASGVVEQALGIGCRAALHLEAALAMEALRHEADVPLHRDARAHDGGNDRGELATALELDRVHARVLDEAPGVAYRVAGVGLVAQERHVAHEQRTVRPAAHRAGVVQHLLHGDRQRVGVPEDDHGQRVADQEGIDSRRVGGARGGEVVGREHRDGLGPVALRLEIQDRHLAACALAFVGGGVGAHRDPPRKKAEAP